MCHKILGEGINMGWSGVRLSGDNGARVLFHPYEHPNAFVLFAIVNGEEGERTSFVN